MNRKFGWALASAISLAGIGAASAADMAVKARPMVVPVYNWTGCYIGASAGAKGVGFSDRAYTTTGAGAFAPLSLDLGRGDGESWIAGGQIGCNYQSGKWVFGVEGDAHAQRWSQFDLVGGLGAIQILGGSTFELRSHWQASARGRIGYAMDRTLFYVTGGAAFTEARSFTNLVSFIGPPTNFIAAQTKTLVGGTVGAGVEHAVTDNFTLGLEGRYSLYQRQTFDLGVIPVGRIVGGAAFTVFGPAYRDIRLETGEMMVKANWKFGPTAAVVAKY
jgi:outer membrane immunogenic protein